MSTFSFVTLFAAALVLTTSASAGDGAPPTPPKVKSTLDKSWSQANAPIFQKNGEDAAWIGVWGRKTKDGQEVFTALVRKGAVAKSIALAKDTDLLKLDDSISQREISDGIDVKSIERTGFSRPSPEHFNTAAFVQFKSKDHKSVIRQLMIKTIPAKKEFLQYTLEIDATPSAKKPTKDQEKLFKELCNSIEVAL